MTAPATVTRWSDWWPDVCFVRRAGAVIGVIRRIPGGYITRPRPLPETADFAEAVRIVERRHEPAPEPVAGDA